MLRLGSVAVLTAVVCFAITSTTGFASKNGAQERQVTIPVGATAFFSGLDLACTNEPRAGTLWNARGVDCSRYSHPLGVSTWTTARWIRVTNGTLADVVFRIRR
jgi:hypothetical protein